MPDIVAPASIAAALAAAAAVTAGRQALLRVWPAFATASQRSNRQVAEHKHCLCVAVYLRLNCALCVLVTTVAVTALSLSASTAAVLASPPSMTWPYMSFAPACNAGAGLQLAGKRAMLGSLCLSLQHAAPGLLTGEAPAGARC